MADDDAELDLPVDLGRRLGEDEVVVGPAQRVGELDEQRGVVGEVPAHLLDVAAVVEPDADDLGGPDGRGQVGVGEGDPVAAGAAAASAHTGSASSATTSA